MNQPSFFQDLSAVEIAKIKSHGVTKHISQGEFIFAEGDPVGSFFIIESGHVSIFLDKCGHKQPICTLESGEYFGEMAIFSRDRRAASALAVEDTELLCIDKDWFIEYVESHPAISKRVKELLDKRNEEMVLRESLLESTGINSDRLHVSIKGDPSLRESAFTRERYESVVDKILDQLEPALEDLLLNRSVYRVFLNFNSGEVRTSSVFDPFNEEIHTADKMILKNYVDRHFPKIFFDEKRKMIKATYGFISGDAHFEQLPSHWKKIFSKSRSTWQPVPKDEITGVMRNLAVLRGMPNFYLRNFSISMIKDAIRLQFNCDGTHIVNSLDYKLFLEENVV